MIGIIAGARCAVDGREGTVTEVWDGDSVAVLFDDEPGKVMVVELSDPTLVFEGER